MPFRFPTTSGPTCSTPPRVYFVGLSRSGRTSGARIYHEEISRRPARGENWSSTGMRLVTLAELDDDPARWTK